MKKIRFTQDARQKDNCIIALIIAGTIGTTAIVAIMQHQIEVKKHQELIEVIRADI